MASTSTVFRETVAGRLGGALDALLAGHDRVAASACGPSAIIDDVLDEPIVGLTFRTDYDASQEYGIRDIVNAVTGPDPRRYQMTPEARLRFSVCTDRNAFAVSVRPLPPTFAWGEELPGASRSYSDRWQSAIRWVRGVRTFSDWDTMVELRAEAKLRGVSPLPRRKDALLDAINAATNPHPCEHPEHWPVPFGGGQTLIVRADGGASAVIVAGLRDAIDAGTFAIGSASGPFHTGLLFYDARDETQALRDQRDANHAWYDARMAELAPVRAELEARGHTFRSIGEPREGGWNTKRGQEDSAVRYWVATHGGRGAQQVSGWYSLDELRAEVFAADGAALK